MNVAYENIECLGAASSKSIDEILSKSSCELMTMVELKEIEWADLGSWKSRFEVSKKDAKNNFIAGNVLADQVQSSYIVNQNDEMIVTLGVENLIVINTKGAVLIADKDQYELIKKKYNNR